MIRLLLGSVLGSLWIVLKYAVHCTVSMLLLCKLSELLHGRLMTYITKEAASAATVTTITRRTTTATAVDIVVVCCGSGGGVCAAAAAEEAQA